MSPNLIINGLYDKYKQAILAPNLQVGLRGLGIMGRVVRVQGELNNKFFSSCRCCL